MEEKVTQEITKEIPTTNTNEKKEEQVLMEIVRDTGVPGLYLIKNFLTEEQEKEIASLIDSSEWKTNRAGTRRVQVSEKLV